MADDLEAYLGEVLIGGLEPGAVVLAAYDPAWAARYDREAAIIRQALGAVHSPWSTSARPLFPGCWRSRSLTSSLSLKTRAAKRPTFPRSRPRGMCSAFESRHFTSTACYGRRRRMCMSTCTRRDRPRSAGCSGSAIICGAVPGDRRVYAEAKQGLASRQWKSMQYYAEAKTPVIERILARRGNARAGNHSPVSLRPRWSGCWSSRIRSRSRWSPPQHRVDDEGGSVAAPLRLAVRAQRALDAAVRHPPHDDRAAGDDRGVFRRASRHGGSGETVLRMGLTRRGNTAACFCSPAYMLQGVFGYLVLRALGVRRGLSIARRGVLRHESRAAASLRAREPERALGTPRRLVAVPASTAARTVVALPGALARAAGDHHPDARLPGAHGRRHLRSGVCARGVGRPAFLSWRAAVWHAVVGAATVVWRLLDLRLLRGRQSLRLRVRTVFGRPAGVFQSRPACRPSCRPFARSAVSTTISTTSGSG